MQRFILIPLLLGCTLLSMPLGAQVPDWTRDRTAIGFGLAGGIEQILPAGDRLLVVGTTGEHRGFQTHQMHALFLDRTGKIEASRSFDSVVSPRLHPALATYNVQEVFAVEAEGAGYWVWGLHYTHRDTVEPYIAVRYRVSEDMRVIEQDILPALIDKVYPDGSASRSSYRSDTGIVTSRWATPSSEVVTAIIGFDQLSSYNGDPARTLLAASVRRGNRDWFLLADAIDHSSILVGMDRSTPSNIITTSFAPTELAAQDMIILASGDILVAGRTVTWSSGTVATIRLVRIDPMTGRIRHNVTIDREVSGPVQIIGERGNGEILMSWLEGGATDLSIVTGEGQIVARAPIYDISLGFAVDTDRSLWMLSGSTSVGYIGLPQLSSVEDRVRTPADLYLQ